MNATWVTVARHEDLLDAEWETARLIEADIPAAWVEAESDGLIEVRVESALEARARELLASASEEATAAASSLADDREPEEHRPVPAHSSAEREQLLERSILFAVAGCVVLPLEIYACYLVVRAVRRPEPMAYADYMATSRSLVFIVAGIAIWAAFLFGAPKWR